jgi:alpha-L-arabinofuranosidase
MKKTLTHVRPTRRQFLRNSALGLGVALAARNSLLAPALASVPKGAAAAMPVAPRATDAGDARIEVLFDEPLGTISPNIYGHFTENLGGVIYDGIWVGEDSKVPNVHGIRKSLVDALKKIKAPVIRWPGGCFADSYDWKDGIGPRASRPRRTNFWFADPLVKEKGNIPQRFDPNQFGTNEFVEFCRLSGAEPYIAANVRSLPPGDFDHWVEYCNSPAGSTSLADQRAAGGFRDPFNVQYWGIGNESWGCGGTFTPEEYATEFRRYTTWVPDYAERDSQDPLPSQNALKFVASGPDSADWNWTRGFLQGLRAKGPGALRKVWGLSLHYYSWNLSRGRTENWVDGKGKALDFVPVDWYELMRQGDRLESLIEGHWQVMGEFDPQRRIKLVVDEWGPWYQPGSQAVDTDILGQTITLRDAVMSAATLDIFNRHPDKVCMAACAQMINCLNSLFIGHGDRLVLTPVYHVFDMYAAHQGGQSLRTEFAVPEIGYVRDAKPASFWGLNGAASLREKVLTLTVVNPDVANPRAATIDLVGAAAQSATATVLSNSDIHAHNTFDSPDAVRPQSASTQLSGSSFEYTFPPASVTALEISLA